MMLAFALLTPTDEAEPRERRSRAEHGNEFNFLCVLSVSAVSPYPKFLPPEVDKKLGVLNFRKQKEKEKKKKNND